MAKILVVDDEADLELLIRQKFRKKIKSNDYEFVFASNGAHALQQLEDNSDIDVILSDINMPVMDGLSLLTEVNQKHSLLKTVMVSAYGDMDNIRTAMNRGAFDFITKPVNFNDLEITIDKTIEHVHQTKETLKAIKENNILKMYVDDSVLNFMNSREFESALVDTETIDASVCFIDICSFTKLSESQSADKVVDLLNGYFEVIVREIIEKNGYIDKFIGDAVMAVFRGEDHQQRAVQSCMAVRSAINKLPDDQYGIGFMPKVSIGINSGDMVAGNIGSAQLKRLDYTVIGANVNMAQRLEASAGPDEIHISHSVHQSTKGIVEAESAGFFPLIRGLDPVEVFKV